VSKSILDVDVLAQILARVAQQVESGELAATDQAAALLAWMIAVVHAALTGNM
jgi:hypothetical protein